jgi:hypothetical protein
MQTIRFLPGGCWVKIFSTCIAGLCWLATAPASTSAQETPISYPPAVPLVTHDPYFSIWSAADHLTDSWPVHWTGKVHGLCGLVRIDDKAYRVMGTEPLGVPACRQIGLQVLPTRTIYDFEADGVRLTLTFMSPLLPGDLDLLSRPVTYVTWQVRAVDARSHDVAIHFDSSAEAAVDEPSQAVAWSRSQIGGLQALRIGSVEQGVLKKSGDNRRIDWGYLYVAATDQPGLSAVVGGHDAVRKQFARSGTQPSREDKRMPRAANDDWPVASLAWSLGKVAAEPVTRVALIAYDDQYSIEYLGTKLRPYWRRSGLDMEGLLPKAAGQYAQIAEKCGKFDKELMADALAVGGKGYAWLCAISFRQAIAGHKLALGPPGPGGTDGRPMLFSKECFSNGCIATVDVTYPTAPIFMLLDKELLKASVTPILDYAASPRWKFPFAPHDLGTYPKANGQVYGGGETSDKDQMPVEESANLLLIALVIARLDGDTKYVGQYWPQFDRWARYLKEKGLDPPNQLCTDDFAGHLAHNTNLSIKAILALAAYGRMCEMVGKTAEAVEYRKTAESCAARWIAMAADGDHYRLAFDRPGTWSQKYNLVWDRILDLKVFPAKVAAKEIAFYKTKLNSFGLPLDNRADYTKTDWQVWTATLATSRSDFDALMEPVYAFIRCTPQRVPLTDWYQTRDARQQGFQARPVIGGVFIKLLDDPAVWKKWQQARYH